MTTNATETTNSKPAAKPPAPKPAADAKPAEGGKKSTALAKPGETLPAGVTIAALDEAVVEVMALKDRAAKAINEAAWDLGAKIQSIFDKQLYKARLDAEGKTKYKHWNSFCAEELGLSPTHAFRLMDVAATFQRTDVGKWGVTKLVEVMKLPVEDQKKLLEQGPHQHTKRDLEKKVAESRGKGNSKPRETGRKKTNVTAAVKGGGKKVAARQDTITVAALLEKTATVALYARPERKGERATQRAKKISDQPVGVLKLMNGVKQYITVSEDGAGQLQLKIRFAREAESAEK